MRTYGALAYAGAVEAQARGALHRHLVVRSSVPLDPGQVQVLAMEAGYGCVYDVQVIASAAGMGHYLSKYVTKGGDRERVPWEATRVNTHTGEITVTTSPTYRLRSQSQSWGCTMRQVRQVAALQAAARAMYLRELDDLLAPSEGSETAPPGADPPT